MKCTFCGARGAIPGLRCLKCQALTPGEPGSKILNEKSLRPVFLQGVDLWSVFLTTVAAMPVWMPFAYLSLAYLDKITLNSQLLMGWMSAVFLWGTPALSTLALQHLGKIRGFWALVSFPFFYVPLLMLEGIIGWVYGCKIGVVGCQ